MAFPCPWLDQTCIPLLFPLGALLLVSPFCFPLLFLSLFSPRTLYTSYATVSTAAFYSPLRAMQFCSCFPSSGRYSTAPDPFPRRLYVSPQLPSQQCTTLTPLLVSWQSDACGRYRHVSFALLPIAGVDACPLNSCPWHVLSRVLIPNFSWSRHVSFAVLSIARLGACPSHSYTHQVQYKAFAAGRVHLLGVESQSLAELMPSAQLNYEVSCEHQRDSDIINTMYGVPSLLSTSQLSDWSMYISFGPRWIAKRACIFYFQHAQFPIR